MIDLWIIFSMYPFPASPVGAVETEVANLSVNCTMNKNNHWHGLHKSSPVKYFSQKNLAACQGHPVAIFFLRSYWLRVQQQRFPPTLARHPYSFARTERHRCHCCWCCGWGVWYCKGARLSCRNCNGINMYGTGRGIWNISRVTPSVTHSFDLVPKCMLLGGGLASWKIVAPGFDSFSRTQTHDSYWFFTLEMWLSIAKTTKS